MIFAAAGLAGSSKRRWTSTARNLSKRLAPRELLRRGLPLHRPARASYAAAASVTSPSIPPLTAPLPSTQAAGDSQDGGGGAVTGANPDANAEEHREESDTSRVVSSQKGGEDAEEKDEAAEEGNAGTVAGEP